MKAAVLHQVENPVVVQEIKEPDLHPHEALVEIRAAALNHRDLWIMKGLYPGVTVPMILGSDGAGVVQACEAHSEWVGREVIINPSEEWGEEQKAQGAGFKIRGLPDPGTLAEKIAVPVGNLVAKPPHLNWVEAAALPLAGLTAYRALFTRARLQKGDRVLITGIGGGVALLALQLALAAGCRVSVTSGSSEKLAFARKLGAEQGVNYRDESWAKLLGQGDPHEGFDVIVDSAGGPGFSQLVELAAPGGRIVFFGATAGHPPELPSRLIFWKQLSLLGTTMGSPQEFSQMVAYVTEKKIRPLIDSVFPLDEAAKGLAKMEEGKQCGKIVLEISKG